MSAPTQEKDVEALKDGESVVFLRPVRKAEDDSLEAHYCVPAIRKSDGQLLVGDDIMLEGSQSKVLEAKILGANIRWVLNKTIARMRMAAARGENAKTIIPINAMALTLKEVASAFSETCRQMEPELKEHFVVEAFNFAPNMNLSFLDNVAILFYPFSPVYLARPNRGWLDFKILANCNFQGVSMDMQNKSWPVEKVQPYLTNFVLNSQAHRLPTYAHGLATPAIATAAKEANFDFLDGNAF